MVKVKKVKRIKKYLYIENKALFAELHPTKNKGVDLKEITYGSGQKLFWLCDKGHVWPAIVNNRNGKNSCCPTCNKVGTSDIERIFYYFLQLIFKNTINGHKIKNDGKRPVEIDIFIPEINLAIEYDGTYYHKGKAGKKRDIFKNNFLNKKQIPLLRIRDKGLPKIHDIEFICDYHAKNSFKNTLIEILNYIIVNFKLTEKQNQNTKKVKNINFDNHVIPKGFFVYPLKNNSLAKKNKKLAKQWHPTLNGGLQSEHVSCNTKKKVYWLCDCGHIWKARITDRSNSTLCCCPKCALKHQTELKQTKVNQIDIKTNKIIKTFPSMKQVWKDLKISQASISMVCNGVRNKKTAGGFKWEFVKKPKKK